MIKILSPALSEEEGDNINKCPKRKKVQELNPYTFFIYFMT